jgi:DNA-binding NtrC family response regulator
MIKGTVLIVDGNRDDHESLKSMLSGEVERIVSLNDPKRIHEAMSQHDIDIVLMEMNFRAKVGSGNEGLFWMKEIFGKDQGIVVILITSNRDVETAVRAIQEGAFDFIAKPWERSKLLTSVTAASKLRMSVLETRKLKNDNQQLKRELNSGGERIIRGASPTMINVMNIVRKVAPTEANVLITGENGTGKELVAREIHNLSKRSGELLVTVDMGSITETLFESELFGHVRGAFTDAREERKGKFEAASGGTLFLDEIGNLSLQSQAKLLSVLQSRQVVRVGSNKPVAVDIRLICATNRNLQEMVRKGQFREDLFYRLNTIVIEVPPLRDRVDDIPILANYFLRVNAERYARDGMKISTAGMEKLANYTWPGNVRELQHSIEKAVIMSESPVLKPSDFNFGNTRKSVEEGDLTLEEIEKRAIQECLEKNNNNMSKVAGILGITRQTLYNKVRKYGL